MRTCIFTAKLTGWRLGLLAVGAGEVLRPLFVRWASEDARTVYATVMSQLWSAAGHPAPATEICLSSIMALPEASFDDSNYRDIYINRALGVIYSVLSVVQAIGEGAPDLGQRLDELEDLFEDITREFEVPDVRTLLLEARAAMIEGTVQDVLEAVTGAAEHGKKVLNAALAPVAAAYGWPVERVRGPA